MELKENLAQVLAQINNQAKLIVVTKTQSLESLEAIYNANYKVFGENKVQEMASKYELLPKDIEWHLIGHLQTNKVKYIAPFVSMIHSVDSISLLEEINKRALQNNRIIDCLLQIHIGQEETKFGFSESEALNLIRNNELGTLKNIRIVGLMGMASFTENLTQVRNEFKMLNDFFKICQIQFNETFFNQLSMGMSGDYQIAIEEGSTIVRVGSAVFGKRV